MKEVWRTDAERNETLLLEADDTTDIYSHTSPGEQAVICQTRPENVCWQLSETKLARWKCWSCGLQGIRANRWQRRAAVKSPEHPVGWMSNSIGWRTSVGRGSSRRSDSKLSLLEVQVGEVQEQETHDAQDKREGLIVG